MNEIKAKVEFKDPKIQRIVQAAFWLFSATVLLSTLACLRRLGLRLSQ